jgi:hypothetical protein
MFSQKSFVKVGLLALLLAAGVAAPVQAVHDDSGDEEEDGDTFVDVNIDIQAIVNAIESLSDDITDFTGNWDETLKEVLLAVIVAPFRTLLQQLLKYVALLLTNTPRVHPNPAVTEIHRLTLSIAYLFAGLAVAATGLLYQIGPILGVSYREAKLVLPRILIALVFASIAPPLLQHFVELADALSYAFQPEGLTAKVGQMAGLAAGLIIVIIVQSVVLLAFVLMFLIRGVYILFTVAISPLIAIAWSFPTTKRYADTYIAGFWTALAMAPLDMLVLRFNLALLDLANSGATPLQALSNWVFGLAGFTLLVLVPYQLYGASQAALGQSYLLARGIKKAYRKNRRRRNTADSHSDSTYALSSSIGSSETSLPGTRRVPSNQRLPRKTPKLYDGQNGGVNQPNAGWVDERWWR